MSPYIGWFGDDGAPTDDDHLVGVLWLIKLNECELRRWPKYFNFSQAKQDTPFYGINRKDLFGLSSLWIFHILILKKIYALRNCFSQTQFHFLHCTEL